MIQCNTYNIHLDDKQALKQYITDSAPTKIIVIVDENTEKFCLPLLESMLSDIKLHTISISSGEQHKTIVTCRRLWDSMIQIGADRHSLCINLGGGVIGDMGGFAAATFMRGMDFIQVPTTLLSQVDASVGGKLGVDFDGYKNLVGIIQDPGAVFMFTEFLSTLPYRQLRSGFAELIKHGLIADEKSYHSLSCLEDLEKVSWSGIVHDSVLIKKSVTDQDPQESNLRKILNFGHTLGHAIESVNLTEADPLLHGEAIAIGMIMEAHLSYAKEYITLDDCHLIKANITRLYGHHPARVPSLELLLPLMAKDKKNKGGNIRFSLLESIGKACFDQVVTTDEIGEAIAFYND